MHLSDELARADSYCESVLKKSERSVAESYIATKLADAQRALPAGAPPPGTANIPPLGIYCAGKPVVTYVANFKWDEQTWDVTLPLTELSKKLLEAAEKVDTDLRAIVQVYTDKRTAFVAAERKRR